MISFRMETELLDKLNKLKEPKTDVIQKALELYLQNPKKCNTSHKENVNTECNTVNQVGQVKPSVQIVENHELMEYLKRDNEWLKDRIEHFEQNQDHIIAKVDAKAKKETSISLYRM